MRNSEINWQDAGNEMYGIDPKYYQLTIPAGNVKMVEWVKNDKVFFGRDGKKVEDLMKVTLYVDVSSQLVTYSVATEPFETQFIGNYPR